MGLRVTIDGEEMSALGPDLGREAASAVWYVAQCLGAEVAWSPSEQHLQIQSPDPTLGRMVRERLSRSLSGSVLGLRSFKPPPPDLLAVDARRDGAMQSGSKLNAAEEVSSLTEKNHHGQSRSSEEERGEEMMPDKESAGSRDEASGTKEKRNGRSERHDAGGHQSTVYHRPYRPDRFGTPRVQKTSGCCSAGTGQCGSSLLRRYEPK